MSDYIFVNGKSQSSDDELYHYGVLGMKWGVRRYQNEDGSLTDRGKERFNSVAGSAYKVKRDTRRAVKVLKVNQRRYKQWNKASDKAYNRQLKKAAKYEKGSAAYDKAIRGSKTHYDNGRRYLELHKKTMKLLTDISDGTKKAGRDFIVQTDLNIRIFNPGMFRDFGATVNENAHGNYTKRTTYNPLYGTKDRQIIERRQRR